MVKLAVRISIVVVIALAGTARAEAQGFDFQFNVDGVLPSSQLATYGGNYPEAEAFFVAGGLLQQSTLGAGADVEAWYSVKDSFDHTLPATLEWRARFVACPGDCFASAAVSLQSPGYHWIASLGPTGVTAGGMLFPMDTTDAMHVYRLEIPANEQSFKLFVDGELRFSGVPDPLDSPSEVWWGDGTPTGGNAAVEWDYVTLRNSVPTFNVCALYDQSRAVRAGATVPIKLRLCDSAGANLSSASTIVRAISVIRVSDSVSSQVEDAGNANPDDNFRYDISLEGYMFNFQTTGLESGTYRLNFKAGDDPSTHSVQFQVR